MVKARENYYQSKFNQFRNDLRADINGNKSRDSSIGQVKSSMNVNTKDEGQIIGNNY